MRILLAAALVAVTASSLEAQGRLAKVEASSPRDRARTGVLLDPVRVDSAHYKLEFEDAHIRILRVRLPAGAQSVMHEHHKALCIVAISDERTQHVLPDSTTTESENKAGTVSCNQATPGWYRHRPSNVAGKDSEYLVIERKTPGYARGLQPAQPAKPAQRPTP